jgi:hypothetical protein
MIGSILVPPELEGKFPVNTALVVKPANPPYDPNCQFEKDHIYIGPYEYTPDYLNVLIPYWDTNDKGEPFLNKMEYPREIVGLVNVTPKDGTQVHGRAVRIPEVPLPEGYKLVPAPEQGGPAGVWKVVKDNPTKDILQSIVNNLLEVVTALEAVIAKL